MVRLVRYHKKGDYSYTLGAFPTFELLKNKPQQAEMVLLHSSVKEDIRKKTALICSAEGIPFVQDDGSIERIREKDSCLVAGVFRKYQEELDQDADHVVLVNPGDCGNLGTIIRSCVGFGIHHLAIIEPAADIFHPKTVRASMGAVFHMKFCCFTDFKEYYQMYGKDRNLYPFMLKGASPLGSFPVREDKAFSLIFGNESSGLPDSFLKVGRSVLIPHSEEIDSLNLSLATGIGIYEFTKKKQHRNAPL